MKKLSLILMSTILGLSSSLSLASYRAENKDVGSYIYIQDGPNETYRILFCETGKPECKTLGGKDLFTKDELNTLISREHWGVGIAVVADAGIIIATGVAAGIAGMGGAVGLGVMSADAGVGVIGLPAALGGVAISSWGVSLIHNLNPVARHRLASFVKKYDSGLEEEVELDIKDIAIILDKKLKNLE